MGELSANALTRLATVGAVDLNTLSPTTLYNVPAGKSAVVTHFGVRSASGALSTVAVSAGYNGTVFDDVLGSTTYTALTGSTLATITSAKTGLVLGTATAVLKLKPIVAQGSAVTCSVDVFGYLY